MAVAGRPTRLPRGSKPAGNKGRVPHLLATARPRSLPKNIGTDNNDTSIFWGGERRMPPTPSQAGPSMQPRDSRAEPRPLAGNDEPTGSPAPCAVSSRSRGSQPPASVSTDPRAIFAAKTTEGGEGGGSFSSFARAYAQARPGKRAPRG